MRLKIKHLAPYLPYGLKGKVTDLEENENWFDEIEHICFRDNILSFKDACDVYLDEPNETIFKPILRPLSDLTKEIEVSGEKFVPIIELCKLSFDYLDVNKTQLQTDNSNGAFSINLSGILGFTFDSNDNSFIALNKGKTVCVPNQLKLFEKLFEWHFDVFGLIEQGLAININEN